ILDQDISGTTHAKMKGALGYWGKDQSVAILKRVDPSAIDGKDVSVLGYAGDTCGNDKWTGSATSKQNKIDNCYNHRNDEWASTSWRDTGTLTADASRIVYHTADTYEGQSGGPICLSIGNVLHLVAVHTGNDNAQRNKGVRVTRRMLRELCGWINADA